MIPAPRAELAQIEGDSRVLARACQMPLTDNDLLTVPEGRFASLKRDDLLRIVVLCRASDDPEEQRRARGAWEMLVALDRDRIVTLVKLFRVKGHDARVAQANVEDVAHAAWERMCDVLRNFEGTVIPQYEAAMRTCVDYACRDHCRIDMRADMRSGGSLDESIETDEGSSRGRFDGALGKHERERILFEAQIERADERREAVREAIEAMEDERKRDVLLMTWDKVPDIEIAERLETSVDNVYQLRRRGLIIVREMLEDDG
jgi:RNA polymerase sigma factor (sigma-70 family)